MPADFDILLQRYLTGTLSIGERMQLLDMIATGAYDSLLDEELDAAIVKGLYNGENDQAIGEKIYVGLRPKLFADHSGKHLRVAHRAHFVKTSWFRYAAAIIILLTGFSVYLLYPKKQNTEVAKVAPSRVLQDVMPGSNKAVLTLADGQQIKLDSTANALLEGKGITNHNSLVAYSGKGIPDAINTLSTPKGGQYQLRLPDGTMVWLNAASSITYPTIFTGPKREVSITGEAYFEVTKNKEKPFIVQAGKQQIKVLGTHFNINAYPDEPAMKTSLAEGAIQIGDKILHPGEAYVNGTVMPTDLSKDLAWKNGYFNFEGADLEMVMRQLGRWYNLDIEYSQGVPQFEFGGKLKRDLNLSQIIMVLENSEVNLQLEGRRLIVKP